MSVVATKTAVSVGGARGAWNRGSQRAGVELAFLHTQSWTDVATKSATAVVNAAAVDSVIGASVSVTFAHPRTVQAVLSSTGTEVLTITGTDGMGAAQTETLTLAGTTIVRGNKAFRTITAWALSALAGAGRTLNVGSDDRLGLDVPCIAPEILAEFLSNASLEPKLLRCTTALASATDVTLSDIPGLSFTLAAGATYYIAGELYVTSTANGGVEVGVGGTATATATQLYASTYDAAQAAVLIDTAEVTSLGSLIDSGTAVVTRVTFGGYITVNAAGTFTITACQGASHADTTTIKTGSWCQVTPLPGILVAGTASSATLDPRGTYEPPIATNAARDFSITYLAQRIDSFSTVS